MVDWKKYGESIGYTQARMSKETVAWYNLAVGYNRAAQLLHEFSDRIPRDSRPAPNSESKWDEYQDFTFESHVIRTTIGNVSTAMANRDTFPDWNNYERIWALCLTEYESAA